MKNSLEDFEKLYRRYRAGLVHFAMGIIGSAPDAEEIVQDMFMAVWARKEQFSFDDSIKNYLFTGIKNRCLNHIKKVRLPYADMPDEFPVPSLDANVLDRLQARETESKIQILIDMLPMKCRQVFLLSRLHELSYKEIAAVMDITPKTVENQIGIALKFLKQGMGLSAPREKGNS